MEGISPSSPASACRKSSMSDDVVATLVVRGADAVYDEEGIASAKQSQELWSPRRSACGAELSRLLALNEPTQPSRARSANCHGPSPTGFRSRGCGARAVGPAQSLVVASSRAYGASQSRSSDCHSTHNRMRIDHPDDHPDDPSGFVGSRLDRRVTQREQARSVCCRPVGRGAFRPGIDDHGRFAYSTRAAARASRAPRARPPRTTAATRPPGVAPVVPTGASRLQSGPGERRCDAPRTRHHQWRSCLAARWGSRIPASR
jgi:hypothetical protein